MDFFNQCLSRQFSSFKRQPICQMFFPHLCLENLKGRSCQNLQVRMLFFVSKLALFQNCHLKFIHQGVSRQFLHVKGYLKMFLVVSLNCGADWPKLRNSSNCMDFYRTSNFYVCKTLGCFCGITVLIHFFCWRSIAKTFCKRCSLSWSSQRQKVGKLPNVVLLDTELNSIWSYHLHFQYHDVTRKLFVIR